MVVDSGRGVWLNTYDHEAHLLDLNAPAFSISRQKSKGEMLATERDKNGKILAGIT